MHRTAVRVVALLALAGCSSGSPGSPAGAPTPSASSPGSGAAGSSPAGSASPSGVVPVALPDWPTYHGSDDRAGASTAYVQAPLRRAWSRSVDAPIYGQPIVAAGRVIAATENNTVYAVDPRNGRVQWRRHLSAPEHRSQLPCGNVDPSGITGTPAYDASTRSVFVVTESAAGARHTLVALDVASGAVRWSRSVDVATGRDPLAEQERGALLVANGRVYVPFGGRAGDCGNYVGYLAAVPVDGHGAVLHYAVPTQREAGMWAAPGAVLGPGGDIYVASGNGAEVGGSYDGSDSVIRLSPTLHRLALFAPTSWPQDNAEDLDLGSMSPVMVEGQIVIAGKRGDVYLLAPALGGIGGQLATLDGCAGYGGAAVHGADVVMPCNDGIRMLHVSAGHLTWRWRTSFDGSPAVASGGVVAFDRDAGDLVLLSLSDGHLRARVHVGTMTRFATPAPVGHDVFVGTTTALVAVTSGS